MFADLKDYGFTQAEFSAAQSFLGDNDGACLVPGRVIECRRERFGVICEYGEVPAELKGSFYHKLAEGGDFPVVGDFVLIQYNSQGSSLIAGVLP